MKTNDTETVKVEISIPRRYLDALESQCGDYRLQVEELATIMTLYAREDTERDLWLSWANRANELRDTGRLESLDDCLAREGALELLCELPDVLS